MASEKTLAIVLRTVEFSETSLVVTLFTEDFGRIGVVAKGARRPKSPFEAALDLLSICRVVFIHKSSGGLDLLTEARLERRFRAAGRNLPALYGAYYVAELLRELTDEHDPHPQLFRVAHEALVALDENHDVAACVLHFELSALRLLGHLPSLDKCASCGKDVQRGPRMAFGLLAGGVLCAMCRPRQRQVASVSGEVIQLMQSLAAAATLADMATTRLDPRRQGELRGLLNRYICNLLGHRPRLQALLPKSSTPVERGQ